MDRKTKFEECFEVQDVICIYVLTKTNISKMEVCKLEFIKQMYCFEFEYLFLRLEAV